MENNSWKAYSKRYYFYQELSMNVQNQAEHIKIKNFSQINDEIKDFAERAKNKKLTPAEIEGSTFTISNLGMFGIESFTSIINQPNSAILSVGSIIQKPIVKDGEIVVGNTMKLTLACDHRTVDGATGSSFLQTLKANNRSSKIFFEGLVLETILKLSLVKILLSVL